MWAVYSVEGLDLGSWFIVEATWRPAKGKDIKISGPFPMVLGGPIGRSWGYYPAYIPLRGLIEITSTTGTALPPL